MILPIFLAFSCEMPSFRVETMRYSLPLAVGSPESRLFSEMPRLMSFVWKTSRTAFARSSEFALMRIASPLHSMEASVPLKSYRCSTSLRAWLSALSASCRSIFETMSKLESAMPRF